MGQAGSEEEKAGSANKPNQEGPVMMEDNVISQVDCVKLNMEDFDESPSTCTNDHAAVNKETKVEMAGFGGL